jgi:tetratricopeptide (TPR) repeat protein
MTQEDKAKAYDKALKVIKDNLDALDEIAETGAKTVNIQTIKNCFHRAFPELQESNDEKIRKSIIHALQGDGFLDMEETNKAISWLEKQGEQKQDPCDNCKDVMLNCHNFPCIKKRAFKQGKSVLEAIIDEKVDNANKVEQKFKVGDVLNSPSHHLIWIYKDNKHYYACVNMNYVTENVATNGLISIPNDACPATKEQRKQLEKAMADAGYAFDFDKKEFKKIEQKPAWSEWDEEILSEIIDFFENGILTVQHDFRIYASWLKSLKQKYTWKPSDKQMNTLRHVISGCSYDIEPLVEMEEQLKKLK